jgi:hypothetical protein
VNLAAQRGNETELFFEKAAAVPSMLCVYNDGEFHSAVEKKLIRVSSFEILSHRWRVTVTCVWYLNLIFFKTVVSSSQETFWPSKMTMNDEDVFGRIKMGVNVDIKRSDGTFGYSAII